MPFLYNDLQHIQYFNFFRSSSVPYHMSYDMMCGCKTTKMLYTKCSVFWDVTPCSLLDTGHCSRGTRCSHPLDPEHARINILRNVGTFFRSSSVPYHMSYDMMYGCKATKMLYTKCSVFWDVTPCSLLDTGHCSRGTRCSHPLDPEHARINLLRNVGTFYHAT